MRRLHERVALDTNCKPIQRTLPYHAPCQLRAHGIGRPALVSLELVSGLHLTESTAACCGLAGSYGSTAERYQIAGHSALVVQAGTISTRLRGEINSFNVVRVDRPHIVVERWEWQDARLAFAKASERMFRHSEHGWSPPAPT